MLPGDPTARASGVTVSHGIARWPAAAGSPLWTQLALMTSVQSRTGETRTIAATLELHGRLGQSLATAGPVAVTETWGKLRTESAHHAVLWVSEWFRSLVYPGFLSPVLLSAGIQRSFSLICTPMRSDAAAHDIRKKKVEHISDQAQRAKIGQIEDASQTAEYHDVLQQEANLTAGHGILHYTGLIAVSAPTVE